MSKKYYLCGKISGLKCYKTPFLNAERLVKAKYPDAVVVNPTVLPWGLEYEEYMDICMAMVRSVDVIVVLPNWKESPGAIAEKMYGACMKKELLDLKSFEVGR